jgi:hypothetical protein
VAGRPILSDGPSGATPTASRAKGQCLRLARKRNDRFRLEAVESCRSLSIVPADLFRPVPLVEIRPAVPHADESAPLDLRHGHRPSNSSFCVTFRQGC